MQGQIQLQLFLFIPSNYHFFSGTPALKWYIFHKLIEWYTEWWALKFRCTCDNEIKDLSYLSVDEEVTARLVVKVVTNSPLMVTMVTMRTGDYACSQNVRVNFEWNVLSHPGWSVFIHSLVEKS